MAGNSWFLTTDPIKMYFVHKLNPNERLQKCKDTIKDAGLKLIDPSTSSEILSGVEIQPIDMTDAREKELKDRTLVDFCKMYFNGEGYPPFKVLSPGADRPVISECGNSDVFTAGQMLGSDGKARSGCKNNYVNFNKAEKDQIDLRPLGPMDRADIICKNVTMNAKPSLGCYVKKCPETSCFINFYDYKGSLEDSMMLVKSIEIQEL